MEDGSWAHVCKCTKEMGDLVGEPCNLDWQTAGEERPTYVPPKLEVEDNLEFFIVLEFLSPT